MTEQELVPIIFAVYLWAVFLWAQFNGDRTEKETLFLLCGVWILSALVVLLLDTDAPIWAFFFIDVVAGWSVWKLRRERWQGVIISLFAAMILVHLGYFIGENGAFAFKTLVYNRMINSLFVAQITTCGWAILSTSYGGSISVGNSLILRWYSRFDGWLHVSCGIDDNHATGARH